MSVEALSTQSDAQADSQVDSQAGDFFALLKPRVMSLVIFTGLAGMMIAPGVESVHPLILFMAMLCLSLGSGAAGAINMWYDRDIDAVMTRTKSRPIPAGRVDPTDALTFALALSVFSVAMMALAVNWKAAGLLAFAIFFYSVIYTMWLKRLTPENIVIGGAAGAFPPMIGWAAVTGDVSWVAISLFAIIFFWTPPHFWALSLYANDDYKRANIPMMAVVKGIPATKLRMVIYSVILFAVSLLPYALGAVNEVYLAAALILGALFVASSVQVYRHDAMTHARRMFAYSVFYLFALFLALMVSV